eukprot:s2822_g9.t1
MVTIVERGHSMSDGQWAEFPFELEYKVSASEWLFNSTSQAYVLYDRDYDAHTPLLIEDRGEHGTMDLPIHREHLLGQALHRQREFQVHLRLVLNVGKSSKGKETAKGKSNGKN